MAERAGLFEEDLDLSQFTPQKPAKAEQPPPEAVRAVAEGAKFQSREPSKAGEATATEALSYWPQYSTEHESDDEHPRRIL